MRFGPTELWCDFEFYHLLFWLEIWKRRQFFICQGFLSARLSKFLRIGTLFVVFFEGSGRRRRCQLSVQREESQSLQSSLSTKHKKKTAFHVLSFGTIHYKPIVRTARILSSYPALCWTRSTDKKKIDNFYNIDLKLGLFYV